MAGRYRKRPVVIEAMQFTGDNGGEVIAWATRFSTAERDPIEENLSKRLIIWTLEGNMVAQPGDWIIKGVQGEFYPCKPDIFEQTYEAVEDAVADDGTPPRFVPVVLPEAHADLSDERLRRGSDSP